MRAYRFDNSQGLDGLQVHDEPTPSPQRGELLLKIRAVALNYCDIAIPLGRYVRDSTTGLVPCSDAAAEVVAAASTASLMAVGVIATMPFWARLAMSSR